MTEWIPGERLSDMDASSPAGRKDRWDTLFALRYASWLAYVYRYMCIFWPLIQPMATFSNRGAFRPRFWSPGGGWWVECIATGGKLQAKGDTPPSPKSNIQQ